MVWSKIVWDVTRRVGDNMDGLGPTLTGPYPRRRETGGSGRTNPPIKGAPRRVEDVSLSGGADLVRALPNSSVVTCNASNLVGLSQVASRLIARSDKIKPPCSEVVAQDIKQITWLSPQGLVVLS